MNKPLSRTKKNLLYALIGGSLFWPFPPRAANAAATAQAQAPPAKTASDQRQFNLEGVEVTVARDNSDYVAKRSSVGTRTDTPLRDTPQSINVITREQLDVRGATDLFEALEYSAGITAQPYDRDFRWNNSMVRGFGVEVDTDGLRLFNHHFAVWSLSNTAWSN